MIDLLIGEFKRTWIQTRRYPAEVIGGIVILTSVFYGIFVSSQYMAGPTTNFGNRLDAIVVGYVIWTLVLYIVNDIANNLQLEAQTGTLEQVFLSPFGAPRVFFGASRCELNPAANADYDRDGNYYVHYRKSAGLSGSASAASSDAAIERLRAGFFLLGLLRWCSKRCSRC